MICIHCRKRRRCTLEPLPLTGQLVALCARCRNPHFIAHMRSLIAHG